MMSSNQSSKMNQILVVCTEQLVPKDHLLRKVAALVDFNFVYDLCKDLYSQEEGRPSIDPVILVKLALIQKLFGIRSMRKTISEVEVNVAYRWFLGDTLLDPILHFGAFSKNYVRRFKESLVF
ncbi:Mobile element protein [Clostridiaceae bacterium JG1575]|nr:Mobile element protein [Clostridiaceae bacterium JG1575]